MFEARKNPDGSITLPFLPQDDAFPAGTFVDGEVTIHPEDDNYAEAVEYLNATSNPLEQS